MDEKKNDMAMKEKDFFLKLVQILARENLIQEGEKNKLRKRIREKWESSRESS